VPIVFGFAAHTALGTATSATARSNDVGARHPAWLRHRFRLTRPG
jgi:hypothetical protein